MQLSVGGQTGSSLIINSHNEVNIAANKANFTRLPSLHVKKKILMEFPSLRFISSVKDILVLFEHSSRRLDSSSHFRMDNNLPGSQFREVHIAWSWPASRERMPCLQRHSLQEWQHSRALDSSTSQLQDSIHQDSLEVVTDF